MTNGEKIMQAFPDLQIDMGELEVYMWTTTHDAIDIPLDWWNAEYKEPDHIADAGKMIEPITKNDVPENNVGKIEPANKSDLAVELISREDVLQILLDYDYANENALVLKDIKALPSVTPQEPQSFKWCTDCKEYDTEKHCCHRYSKVIKDTVAEIRQEPVLDKIRAEIKELQTYFHEMLILDEVMQIIDKYKVESEV